MSFRCIHRLCIAAGTLLMVSGTCHAGAIVTTAFLQTNCDFTWEIQWIDPNDRLGSALVVNSDIWDLSATTANVAAGPQFDIDFHMQHRAIHFPADCCHPQLDARKGEENDEAVDDVALGAIRAADLKLGTTWVEHAAVPQNHWDVYTLFYRRPGEGQGLNDDVFFTLNGRHLVPEPGTLALGLAGMATLLLTHVWRLRQRR